MQQRLVNRTVLILVLLVISAFFLKVVEPFLMSIFLAALFAALFSPLYHRILRVTGDREALASIITVIAVLLFLVVPLALVFGSVLTQALEIAQAARPWVQDLTEPGALTEQLQKLPFYEQLLPYREFTLDRLNDMTGIISKWVVDVAQAATLGTVSALLTGLIILYTMFFFLIDGDRLLYMVLYYLPLNNEDETRLLSRFVSVTRATLKGTAVIGFLQGALAGAALGFAGISSALFWAVVMMFLSVVPGIGTALVWVPAVIFLAASGQYAAAIAVALFCALVVGAIDNLLRPRLVGNDTQLHELMIFFSTLGGLVLFGFMGFVIGPIIAALFVTVWELYGDEFRDYLPYAAFKPRRGQVELPHQIMLRAEEERRRDAEQQGAAGDTKGRQQNT